MSAIWRVAAQVQGADAAIEVAALLDALAGNSSAFETAPAATEWRIEAFSTTRLLLADAEIRLALAAAASGGKLIEVAEERLGARDWLAENRLAFPPLRVGRFWVHASHEKRSAPPGAIVLEIDAATAFGTGEHASTQGCLRALDLLARRRRFHRPLDIGTGTGILAIAAAKRLHRRVLASDIDAGSVRLARDNARRNGVAALVRFVEAPGYRHRRLRRSRHDLIFANILARPLALMASDLAGRLAPGGRAVLSGLLRRQEAMVLAPHRGSRIALERRILIDGWSTLILRSGRS